MGFCVAPLCTRWAPCRKLILGTHYPHTFSHKSCLYNWEGGVSLSVARSHFSRMLQQSPVNLACSRLASFLLFQLFSVGHVAFCCILLLGISTFTATFICTFFPPLCRATELMSYLSFSFFMSPFFLHPATAPNDHRSTRSSHLLSKQLGFLNSRLWQ